jgi:sigma-B regulation protein RsbU (phosphoserine phosphatase)
MAHGVVWLDHILETANVNPAAADLLDLPPGEVPASDFISAMKRLGERASNHAEIPAMVPSFFDDVEDIDVTFRFAGAPTLIHVSSYTARQGAFSGTVWAFEDVSALADALEASEAAQALLRASADSMLDPQMLLEAVRDRDGRVVDFVYRSVNPATCSYLGLDEGDLVGHHQLEFTPNMDSSGLHGRYIQCLEDGKPLVLDDFSLFNEILDDARRYDIRATVAGPDLLNVTRRDVTDRFDVTQRIAASEQNYRLLAENAGDMVAHVRDGTFVWVSPSAATVVGASASYWVGREMREIIPPADLSAFSTGLKTLALGGVIQQRIRVKSADGGTHWIDLHAKPFHDAEGRQDGFTAALRLVDDQVAGEQAVEAVEAARRLQTRADERYRRLMDNAAVGMCMTTPQGRFTDVNDAMCELFGYAQEALTQMTWQELTAPGYLEADIVNVEKIMSGQIDSYRLTKQFIRADDSLVWGDLSVGCLRNSNGDVEQFIGQITDITARVKADERNRVLAQQLQQQTDLMRAELESAASYMASIMPRGLQGAVAVSSRYLPSREIGGDSFDYTWIDDDHFLVYLIDVSGHGLEPALLSVSVHNMLRSGSIALETLLAPEAVLTELNHLFQMEKHSDHYFTMWYGVYEASTRTLRYASAGAPPALAFTSATGESVDVAELSTPSAPVGMFEDSVFISRTYEVPPGCRILVYSDGASDIILANGRQLSAADFTSLSSRIAESPEWSLEALIGELRALTPSETFEDDCSMIQLIVD